MKIKIQIKNYFTGNVLFEYKSEENTIRKTVEEAVKARAYLAGANLVGANLVGANLADANLVDANLARANLADANLAGANLVGANLVDANLARANLARANLADAYLAGANLVGANLVGANLADANLVDANLARANLVGANLVGANLARANLARANLAGAKNIPQSYINICSRDMLFIFEHLKTELPFLREKLIKGEVDGTQYEGECACLIGSLGKANGGVDKVCETIPYYEKGLYNLGEQWFYQIRKGDTPETNFFAKHALELIDSVIPVKKQVRKKKVA